MLCPFATRCARGREQVLEALGDRAAHDRVGSRVLTTLFTLAVLTLVALKIFGGL